MQSDDPFKNAGAGEKVILLTDVRHSATTVKEVLLRVGTRYVLTERIYALQASSARVSAKRYEEWLAKDGGSHKIGPINMTIETELRPLIQVIKQTEHLLAEAKKDLKKESPKDHPREMENFNKLQQLLKEQTEEIRTVRTKLSSLENFVTNGDQYVAQEKEQDQAESLPSQEKDRELTDDEHLSKLIEETKDEGGPVSVVVQCISKRTTHTREFENQRRWIESMEYALKRFPYRKLAAYSDGVEPQRPCVSCGAQSAHFSDSCPIVHDARTRNQIVHDSKLCRLCL
nr:unnamed protein product [Haemonchus contortus]